MSRLAAQVRGPGPPAPDQATRLRALVEALGRGSLAPSPLRSPVGEEPPAVVETVPAVARGLATVAPPARTARVVTVSSGKGGVGKTTTCVNLAIALAAAGRRATLFDADLGTADADVLCGISPLRRLEQLLPGGGRHDAATAREIAVPAPGGFRLVPGSVGVAHMADLGPAERTLLAAAIAELERDSDVILVDTGAGIGAPVLGLVRRADLALVVVTPEPTSITDAYALIKCALAPETPPGFSEGRGCGDAPGGAGARLALVVNQAADRREAEEVHRRIAGVAERFLGRRVPLLGWIAQDVRVAQAVRRRVPLLIDQPHAEAARHIRSLAGALVARLAVDAAPARPTTLGAARRRPLVSLFLRGR